MDSIDYFLSIILFLSFNYSTAQTYLTDGQQVPVFDPAETDSTDRYVYWDLTEINNSNNRLDIGVGVTHYEGNTNFINGNWYKNQNNSNFNDEVTDNRFIYKTNSTETINGFIFSKLNSGRKNAVVSRGNGEIEIYPNQDGTIGNIGQHFAVYGKVICSGKFSTDTLVDVVVLSNSGDTVKIYNGAGNGTLSTAPYKYYGIHPEYLFLAQLSNYAYPFSVIYSTTSDREDLIYREGQYIKILKNSNSNYFTPWVSINTEFTDNTSNDFKIADFNNDGLNDIVAVQNKYGIKVYLNDNLDSFSLNYSNLNYPYSHPYSVSIGDFNKDGFIDLAVIIIDRVNIYINNKSGTLFPSTPSYTYYFDFPIPFKAYPFKSTVADLYNKGGLAVIFSGANYNLIENFNIENLYRINASDTDAVPAPAYLFHTKVMVNGIYHPKLLLFNRGDRDFLKYKIYKKGTYTNWEYALIDSTTNDYYIDTIEVLDTTYHQGEPAYFNLYYYVKAEDNSYKVSVNSDTVKYLDVICPTCPTEPYDPGGDDRGVVSDTDKNNKPGKYSVNNFPNPFNPVTKINYSIPFEGNVRITIFNSLGQTVKELINEFRDAGSYFVQFDGSSLPSAIYYYRIETAGYFMTRKMLLLK